jgi:hypothetical protein
VTSKALGNLVSAGFSRVSAEALVAAMLDDAEPGLAVIGRLLRRDATPHM